MGCGSSAPARAGAAIAPENAGNNAAPLSKPYESTVVSTPSSDESGSVTKAREKEKRHSYSVDTEVRRSSGEFAQAPTNPIGCAAADQSEVAERAALAQDVQSVERVCWVITRAGDAAPEALGTHCLCHR